MGAINIAGISPAKTRCSSSPCHSAARRANLGAQRRSAGCRWRCRGRNSTRRRRWESFLRAAVFISTQPGPWCCFRRHRMNEGDVVTCCARCGAAKKSVAGCSTRDKLPRRRHQIAVFSLERHQVSSPGRGWPLRLTSSACDPRDRFATQRRAETCKTRLAFAGNCVWPTRDASRLRRTGITSQQIEQADSRSAVKESLRKLRREWKRSHGSWTWMSSLELRIARQKARRPCVLISATPARSSRGFGTREKASSNPRRTCADASGASATRVRQEIRHVERKTDDSSA